MEEGLPTFVLVWRISANRSKQKDCFLGKNIHQSMFRNWENSSSMLQSPPKYSFYMEIEISAIVLATVLSLLTYKILPPDTNYDFSITGK